MTDISKLRELLERVESAAAPDLGLDRSLFDMACGGLFWPENATLWQSNKKFGGREPKNFTSSIDAAVALCERVLPGWEIRIGELPDKVGWFARVLRRKDMFLVSSRDCGPKHVGIALCAVVLRAKIAMLEKEPA